MDNPREMNRLLVLRLLLLLAAFTCVESLAAPRINGRIDLNEKLNIAFITGNKMKVRSPL
jgi:hypothetical protein